MKVAYSRRTFLNSLALSLSGMGLTACSEDPDPDRYTQADIDKLNSQREMEILQSGTGPYGVHRYSGYRGLAELPWFEFDSAGELQCVDDSIPLSIDVHCHLGMSVLFKPNLDLNSQTNRVWHLLDCDNPQSLCDLDLDVYVNANFDQAGLKRLKKNMFAQGLWGSQFSETQTIPNLLREMDAMRVRHTILLPIKLGLPFGDDLTEQWLAAIRQSDFASRLHCGFSIHPRDENKLEQVKAYADSGHRFMKLHPTVQRFYPDDPQMMDVYALAEKLGIIIFFHGGRAGIEPESSHPFAMPRHYEAAFANFPKLKFIVGHAGARDNHAMLEIALKYPNTWIDIHGQGLTQLEWMIRKTGGQRLLFGTDWPFYHLGSSLAKVLITTQDPGRQGIRQAILRDNAIKLFGADLLT
jgi:predicted TIM-barrel fold metal-dependent hydrolase